MCAPEFCSRCGQLALDTERIAGEGLVCDLCLVREDSAPHSAEQLALYSAPSTIRGQLAIESSS